MLGDFVKSTQDKLAGIERRLDSLPFVSKELWLAEHERLRDRIEAGERDRGELKAALEATNSRLTNAWRVAVTSLLFPVLVGVIVAVLLASLK